VDFAALRERIHPAAKRVAELAQCWPAVLMLFDVLADGHRDVRARTYDQRRAILTTLLAGALDLI
jgi:ATP-dependent DNA ligase